MRNLLIVAVLAIGVIIVWIATQEDSKETLVLTPDPVTRTQTAEGPVVGVVNGAGGHTWLGIPFAAPPVGELRWRAPAAPTA